MSKTIEELANRYKQKINIVESTNDLIENQYHVNAFINPLYPIITTSEEIQNYIWGLIPFWTKTELNANKIRKMRLYLTSLLLENRSNRNDALSRVQDILNGDTKEIKNTLLYPSKRRRNILNGRYL